MSEIRTEQDLRSRMESLLARSDSLIRSTTLGKADVEALEKRYGEVRQEAFEKFPQNQAAVETLVEKFELYVARLETPPSILQEQNKKSLTASYWMIAFSLFTLGYLVISNLKSMGPIIINPLTFPLRFPLKLPYVIFTNWPNGWFINHQYMVFALAGVSLNILLTLLPRIQQGDWHRKYLGTYAFRVLQALIYAAVIYNFVKVSDEATQKAVPFAVSALFVGMFVNLLEGAFAGIGERFVDMISALFASKFAGPREKAEKIQEIREKLGQLRSRYAEMDKADIDSSTREAINAIFRDALLRLQSHENEQAEIKLQELELKLDNVAQPPVKFISVEPSKSIHSEDNKQVILNGQGFQRGATVRLQKEQEFLDPTDVKVVSERLMRCTLPLKSMAPGKWDIIVVSPNLKEYSLPHGFDVVLPNGAVPVNAEANGNAQNARVNGNKPTPTAETK